MLGLTAMVIKGSVAGRGMKVVSGMLVAFYLFYTLYNVEVT